MGYMTNGLTFNDLEGASLERLKTAEKYRKSRDWSRAEWLQAVVGEVGELANVMKKVDRGDMTLEEARPMLEAEIADVVCYLPLLAQSLGIASLGAAVMKKFNAVSDRIGSGVKVDADGWSNYGDQKKG